MDAELRGRSHIRSYREIVECAIECGLAPRLFREHASDPSAAKILLLRHDVDHSLENAMMLARLDAEIGIASTFFMLPPGDYNSRENYYGYILEGRVRHAADFFAQCREIAAMGHEIGIHNDFVQLSFLTRRPIADLLRDEIAAFADAGLPVSGTAAHGSKFARRHELVNYEIFRGFASGGRPLGRTIAEPGWSAELHQIDMASVGLAYEAYRLPRNLDFSDSGSAVRISSKLRKHTGVNFVASQDLQVLRDAVAEIPDPRLVMLLHPCWWTRL